MWRAVIEGDVGEVRRGLESGVQVGWRNEDEMDRTFLHCACGEGRVGVASLLLEKGARVDARDEDERTPLHRAARGGQEKCVQLLLKHGADVNAQDFGGNTPLHVAAKKGLLQSVKALLEGKATKDVENGEGKTAFEVCTDARVREFILKYGEEEEDNDDDDDEEEVVVLGGQKKKKKRRTCWMCGKKAQNRCTGCKVANYCGADCQKRGWKEHKEDCAKLKKANMEARRIFRVEGLDADAKELVEKSQIPRELLDVPENLFPLLNVLHLQLGKVYSTRHPKTGKKLITVPTSVQEEVALSFFSVENEARLVSEGDPKLLYDIDKDSRMRNVFSAVTRDAKKERVAVKVLQFKDAKQKALMMREVRIVQANQASPNLMQFIACYKVMNKLWLVTEWIDGGNLREACTLHRFTDLQLRFVLRESLRGLENLHSRSVVHRDIKPSNIMINTKGQIKIIDFGLCAEPVDGYLTRMVGSPLYLPPEIVHRLPYDWACDIWSLGVTLLTMCCGGDTPYTDPVLCMFMYGVEGIPMRSYRLASQNGASTSLLTLLQRMLQRNPLERPPCGELLADAVFKSDVTTSDAETTLVLGRIWNKRDGKVQQQEEEDANVFSDMPDAEPVTTKDPRDWTNEVEMKGTQTQKKLAGVLLDEDLPDFLPSALPTENMDDID